MKRTLRRIIQISFLLIAGLVCFGCNHAGAASGKGNVTIELSFPKKMIGKAKVQLYSDMACMTPISGTDKTIVPSDSSLTYTVNDVPTGTCYAKFTFYSDPNGAILCEKEYISPAICVLDGLESKNTSPIEIDKSYLKSKPWVLVTYSGHEDEPFIYEMPTTVFTKYTAGDMNNAYTVATGNSVSGNGDYISIEFHNVEVIGEHACYHDSTDYPVFWSNLKSIIVASSFDVFYIDEEGFRYAGYNESTGAFTALTFDCNVNVAVARYGFDGSALCSFPFNKLVLVSEFSFSYIRVKEIDLTGSKASVLTSTFVGCDLLEKVVIPSCVTVMTTAFNRSSNLKSAYIKSTNITEAFNAFGDPENDDYSQDLIVYVPTGTISSFRALGGGWEEGGYTLEEKDF